MQFYRILTKLIPIFGLFHLVNGQRPLETEASEDVYLLIKDLSKCLIHYVEYEPGIIQFSKLQLPYLFSSSDLWRKNPRYQARPIFKMKYITCFVTMFLIDGYGLKLPISALSGAQRDPFSFIINSLNVHQKFVLFLAKISRVSWSEYNFVRNLNINHQTYLTPIFFLQYEFIQPQITEEGTEISLTESDETEVKLKQGWYICKFCSPWGYQSAVFPCKQGQSCYANMVTAYAHKIGFGRNVLWQVYLDSWNLDPGNFDDIVNYPTRSAGEGDVTQVTMAFLFAPLNRTLLNEGSNADLMVSWSKYETPKVIRKLDRIFGRGSLFVVGNGRSFIFITADEVHDIYDSRNFYVAPFQLHVWHLLAAILTCLTTVVSLAYVTQGIYATPLMAAVTFLWIAGIMLEQNDMKRRPRKVKDEVILQTSATIYAFWIVTCLLMSGFYKGLVSANYSVINPYGTTWKHLRQLVNFSLYSATTNCDFFSDSEYLISPQTKPDVTTLCRDFPLEGHASINCKFWIDLTESIYYREHLAIQSSRNSRQVGRLKHMLGRLSYTCTDYMQHLIRHELKRGQTAFIVSKNDFPMHWEYFEQEMERNSSMKFGHNDPSEGDTYLTKWKVYFLSTVDEFHNNLMKRRMRVLMSSGFIFLWEKWSILNRNFKAFQSQERRKAHRENQISLSFAGSDIQFIFYTLIGGLSLCTLVLIIEKGYWAYWRIQKAKHCPFEYLR